MKAGDLAKNRRIRRPSRVDTVLMHVDSFYNNIYSYYNMGLLYIASYLNKQGQSVICLGIDDLIQMPYKEIEDFFRYYRPAVIGFYTVTDNIEQVKHFASQVKLWSPRSITIAGGPLATSIREKILDHPYIDMCAVGEGEYLMKKLVDYAVKGEGSLDEIPGLIYKEKGRVIVNPPALPIDDLDSLPLPDHELTGSHKNFHVVSGRGCPYNCVFCFQGVHGLKYRYRSAQNVVDEIIENLEKFNSRAFDIIDDTFISNPSRVIEIAKKLSQYRKDKNRDFRFFCQGRVDIMDKHPEMMEALKEAGCCRIQVGIESGDPDTLKIYNKRINTEQIKRVVKQGAKLGGMVIVGNFILGGPFENPQTFQASLDLAKELAATAPGAFEVGTAFMGPYPGTMIAKHPEKFGLKIVDDRFVKGLSLSDCHFTSEAFDVNGIRMLGERFKQEMTRHMKKQIPKIPAELLRDHFLWADRFSIATQWYLSFLKKIDALRDYFGYLQSPRFSRLKDIPVSELYQWFPQRTIEKRSYSPDGTKIILPETTKKLQLKKPEEILLYELSSGKLNIYQVSLEFIRETSCELPPEHIIHKIMLPFYEKLEKTYHILFFR